MEKVLIKRKQNKPFTKFITGGFNPTNSMEDNWIGKVNLYKKDEEIPLDFKGNLMTPLGQFNISSLPFIPEQVKDTKFLTVFISEDEYPQEFEKIGKTYVIREYFDVNELEIKQLINSKSSIKPLPLKAEYGKDDYPYYLRGHHQGHKFGGYQSFCQEERTFPEGFEFVFQISSDYKAGFNFVDGGSLMFAKNVITNEWKIYFDFY